MSWFIFISTVIIWGTNLGYDACCLSDADSVMSASISKIISIDDNVLILGISVICINRLNIGEAA